MRNSPMKRTLLSCSLLLLAASCAAVAGTPISQTRSVDAHARIDVSNIKGSVTVSGWDKPEVSITGTLGDGAKGLAVEGGGWEDYEVTFKDGVCNKANGTAVETN